MKKLKLIEQSFLFLFVFFCAFFFLCCSKKSSDKTHVGAEIPVEEQGWRVTDKRICVLLGYDYNSHEVSSNIVDVLTQKYGAAAEGGLIVPVIFPDDFRHEDRAVNADFFAHLEEITSNSELKLAGVILLGAPDGTHRAIARIQDAVGSENLFPVFSFFSQDEVLGMEAVADIVVDRAQAAAIDGMVDAEYSQLVEEDIGVVLLNTVQLQLDVGGTMEKNAKLLEYVQTIMPSHKVSHYVDAETGLRAVNHFVVD